ncbi:hypothetical protein LPJ78_003673 [Coemansia sp. RSA 989]|nr:acyl-CoA N-acyltransferase [Coemansia mojavensis]KAJ1741529.1 hypothetical protein LPJ68_002760 [Coemansia sp. RSA 1086]KAJ1749772.1 hypothetical protein LPJ79_003453 [Coemansia sp. RSA 1821]KAJ1863997.1 hypothetical protein LPJ78_003673 [Coemansia sp. RSA 989]KAJ1871720.1 hypothetical protein LPJ55_003668 [Coemansia sp. RSA 990]KAJ2670183.1 hypothetical protein IWW42_004141 [Coemansia sp. RSA 1085]
MVLIRVASESELREAIALRIHVFVDIQKFPLDEEVDEYDQTALHFVVKASEHDRVIGTLRVLNNGEEAKLGRVVISPEHQGQGLGRQMMEFVEQHIRSSPDFASCKQIRLGSQLDKQQFYRKCGYEARGNVYDELGCPHIWMYKDIL